MRKLVLNDTLTRKKKEVVAEDGETLRFYCCGPTVYGAAHIGNFRTFLVQDLFRRVVELTGLPTRHVRNITDVDDKTIKESQKAGKSLKAFTDHWVKRLHADCAALNMLEPHLEPSAVAHIQEQIDIIEKLVENGHAYQGDDGSVYFKVSSFSEYGRLSGVQDRELKLGASASANDADEYEKDDVADFALWKSRKDEDGDNYWDSPWGEGRPGWHLECSAMSMKHLGETFDVHGGGVDLIFPHHENEIAQSEACTGHPFVRHWFHSEHLMVEGKKMSKSEGNMFTVSDIEAKGHSAAELRFALLSAHYRQKANFMLDSLRAAQGNLKRIAVLADRLGQQTGRDRLSSYDELVERARSGEDLAGPFEGAWSGLLDDLNTPKALGEFFSVFKRVEQETLPDDDAGATHDGIALMVAAFGFDLSAVEDAKEGGDAPEEIRELAERRWKAKQEKDWAAADALRDEVAAAGWVIKDASDGYELERA